MIHFQIHGQTEVVFHWVIGIGVGAGFAIIYDTALLKYRLGLNGCSLT